MKFLKFLGWSMGVLVLLAGLVYGFLPAIGTTLITQGLTNRGFTNVEITINRPTIDALTIPWLTFHTPPESGSTSISIDNTEITYSLDSLLNNVVENVNIERMKIVWDSSLLEKPSAPSSAPPTDSPFDFMAFGSGDMLPVLPFQHLRVKHVDISNPLAPPTLQQISLKANMEALPDRYAGSVQLEGEGLLLNRLTFSVKPDGTVSLTGTHSSAPDDPVLDLRTSLEPSTSGLTFHGQTTLNLHPVIHTLAVLYPMRPEYQAVTGTFSGTWTGTLPNQQSQAGAPLEPIHGEFTLDAQMPAWPPLAQDIQLLTHGTFSVESLAITVMLQPTSGGSVNLSLNSLTPLMLNPFISHKGLRAVSWNIEQPIHVIVPIEQPLDAVHIPTGLLHLSMRNASEQLNVLLSPQDFLWKSSGGGEGKGEVKISTQLKPATTSSLSFESLSLEVHGAMALSTGQIEISLNPASRLRFTNMKNEAMRIPALESRFPKGISWTYLPATQTWEMNAQASTLSLPSFSFQGKQWKLGDILTRDLTITATPQKWAVTGETTITQVRPPMSSFTIPPTDWQARYTVNPTAMTVQFNGQTHEHSLHVGGQGRLNLLTGDGSATMALRPIKFAPHTLILSQLIQPWPNPDMDVTHGTVSASGEVIFGRNPNKADQAFFLKRLHGIVDVQEMGGFFSPTIIQGLTTRMEILGEDERLRIPPTPLRINTIQSAVGLSETSLLFSTGTFERTSIPTLVITNMNTHLLGGTISLANARVDPNADSHRVNLRVHGLDLNEVLRLEQQETVKGTGTLDGTLPLSISGKEITVQQGAIQARAPGGTLHFEVDKETASAWAKSQPQLDLIVKSLENYHYSKLAVGVDYEKSGILKLATTLEGKNPDFRNGVPIHFNLNIEENIPALVKSLSLMKELEQKIEKMMTQQKKP